MKLPLEIKLIIYEYFDPKDKKVGISSESNRVVKFQYFKSSCHINDYAKYFILYFSNNEIQIQKINPKTIIFIRASQIKKFRESLPHSRMKTRMKK